MNEQNYSTNQEQRENRSETVSQSTAVDQFKLNEVLIRERTLELEIARLRLDQDALIRTRDVYFDLYESAPVAYFTVTHQGLIQQANLSAATILEVARDALVMQSILFFIHPQDQELYTLLRRQVIEFGERQIGEMRMIRQNGMPFWGLIQASGVRAADGEFMLRLAVSDISQRKNAEETARRSEERLRLTVQASNVGLWNWDITTNSVHFSPEWKRQLGYHDHEIENRYGEWESRVHPDDLIPTLEKIQTSLTNPSVIYHEVEFRMRRKNDSWCWIRAQAQIFRDGEGKATRMLGCHLDITEHKRLQVTQRESEQRWRSIAENPFDFVVVIDRNYRYVYVNHTAPGITRESLIGLATPFDFAHPHDHATMRAAFIKTFETGSATSYEVFVGQLDAWYSSIVGPIIEDGVVTCVTILTRDITAEKKAEEQQRRLQEQLNHAQKMESLGILAGGVAHDMNNVLGAIIGLASTQMEIQSVHGDTYAVFETICKAADRGATTVKGLLNLARQSPVEERVIDVNVLLREAVRLLERTTLSRVGLHVDLAADLNSMRGDASSLSHAFMNICVNAVDAMSENGTLTFQTRNVVNASIEVVIEDTGSGMSKEVLAKALDPFFTTKEQGKGTGLGLSMVYSTVKAHQGRMEINSELGRGTRITMLFPSCPPEIVQDFLVGERSSSFEPLEWHVLLVDDDDLIRSTVQDMLKELGHNYSVAQNGEEALQQSAPT